MVVIVGRIVKDQVSIFNKCDVQSINHEFMEESMKETKIVSTLFKFACLFVCLFLPHFSFEKLHFMFLFCSSSKFHFSSSLQL